MSEKYYVVSESELVDLANAEEPEEYIAAVRASRAREVFLVSAFDPDTNESATYWEDV